MRVLVTWGSKRGGTEGIGRILAEALRRDGIDVEAAPADRARPDGFDAVIVGGALYANRWHRAARRFVRRHLKALRRVPVWFFSSGPLDDSADRDAIEVTGQVAALMARVGAIDHVTFGGRLERDAPGFAARAMAKEHGGDWRNPARIRAWADQLAAALPTARPEEPVELAGRSTARLGVHVIGAASAIAAARLLLLALGVDGLSLALHATFAVALAAAVARHYFRPRGAHEPLFTAGLVTAATIALDAVVLRRHLPGSAALVAVVTSAGFAFLGTWLVGLVSTTLPWPKPRSA
jgi:menaquinone-dependent protoporphyrinogen oxidase